MPSEKSRYRVVLNTTVVVAALRSKNPSSPNVEIVRRWKDNEFDLLYSDDLLAEYREKAFVKVQDTLRRANFFADLERIAVRVQVSPADLQPIITDDPGDDMFLACAVVGGATHILSYDRHLRALAHYRGVRILRPLDFLYLVRGEVPPQTP